MDIEDLVDEIMLRARHSDPQHENAFVNERIIRADVWSMVQDFLDEFETDRINELEKRLREYEEIHK